MTQTTTMIPGTIEELNRRDCENPDIPQTTLERACTNTDRELWRERKGDHYAPSIHVTEHGGIGMNVGGNVIVMPIEKWHSIAKTSSELRDAFNAWAVANG